MESIKTRNIKWAMPISVMHATDRTRSSSLMNSVYYSVREIQFYSRLPAGMYFVQIKNIAGVTTRKWIVK